MGGDSGFQISNGSGSLTVNQKTLTPNITADNKIYDGSTSATILTRTLTGGIVGSDNVTLTGGTASFSDKNVGNGKTVTATGLSLAGTSAGNYDLSLTPATTANITAKALTASVTGANKIYDGTTAASITACNLSGAIGGDTVSCTSGAATFADKNVGNGEHYAFDNLNRCG